MFRRGRSIQHSDGNDTAVEVDVSVNSTLKHQNCRSFCFWKFGSLNPICEIEVYLRPHTFLSIRKYASYYSLPLLRRGVGRYVELETLSYLDFRFHSNCPPCPKGGHFTSTARVVTKRSCSVRIHSNSINDVADGAWSPRLLDRRERFHWNAQPTGIAGLG